MVQGGYLPSSVGFGAAVQQILSGEFHAYVVPWAPEIGKNVLLLRPFSSLMTAFVWSLCIDEHAVHRVINKLYTCHCQWLQVARSRSG